MNLDEIEEKNNRNTSSLKPIVHKCENGGILLEYGKQGENEGYFIYYSKDCPYDDEKGFNPQSLGIYISESHGYYNNTEWYNVGRDTSAAFESLYSDAESADNLPDMMIISKDYKDDKYDEIIQVARDNVDFDNANISVFGFSKGADYSMRFAQQLIDSEDVNPINLVLIDPAGHGSELFGSFGFEGGYFDSVLDSLKNNGANVYMVMPESFSTNGSAILKVAQAGIPTYLIKTKETDHLTINYKAVTDGIAGFMAGDYVAVFDGEEYKYYKYDGEGWTNISYDEIESVINRGKDIYSSLSNLSDIDLKKYITKLGYPSDTVISSDMMYVQNAMNNIRSEIRNNAKNSKGLFQHFASTTSIPNECSTLLKFYQDSTADLLSKIASETEAIASIALAYKKVDEKLIEEALKIGDERDGV